ncbi:uncharacterized protein A4U43_C02F10030 [Asparagus officinalis]|uniref:Rad21/Rec8-like protein N-terminal domain-containing protein n=1 Tax=Asparagus officinalis TaxID=4686 RepID=A0A5P1FHE1_ASPOF|nr:sister chromatid cohesion 1 protein 3-like isoform X2 [Asparagus officinalis]ONK77738.1 uncharacterized protein A4U43_C02F10030 [Asparagus officinalis]
MFHSQSLLSRKGPLGNIWIAAYCLKKLKRQQIDDTDIISSIDKIIPEIQISYRVLAQLLLGVVRIFSKKVDYLYHDCNEAITNIRRSFITIHITAQNKSNHGRRHAANRKENKEPQHDLPLASEVTHSREHNISAPKNGAHEVQMEAICAPYHDATITLPECFELDAFNLDAADKGETVKPHEKPAISEDEWTNDKNNQHSFLHECNRREVDIHAEFNSACFSPVDDVIQSNMMDLEFAEVCNSRNEEVRGMVAESEINGGLKACSTDGSHLHDNHQERQVHSPNLQGKMHVQKEVQFDEPEDRCRPVSDTTLSNKGEPRDPTEGNSAVRNLNTSPLVSGLPSPQFAVTTPARKETRRMYRKRKILYDETIVLSNGTMRMWIQDASDLVGKRRKVPLTSLDAWRAYRITYLHQNFTDPVIPYISSEDNDILRKKLSDYLTQKKTTVSSIDESNLQHEISDKSMDPHDLQQENTFCGSPRRANYSEISTPDRSEGRMRESSPIAIPSSAFDMIDKALESFEKESDEPDGGWSVRARAVANYLYNKFLYLKEKNRKESLNLGSILEGQTRAKSARFFYETLTLKAKGCIDVEQGAPYADIIVSATPQLESLFKNQ